MGERYQEEIGGRLADGRDAHTGTPVLSSGGVTIGTVASAEEKYIKVEPGRGKPFWLSISVVVRANKDSVQLSIAEDDLDTYALTDPKQLEAGIDAPDPKTEERLDPHSTGEEQEERRRGLVRDDE